ncbi:trafficking protein particle complex subunit 2-like protein isoform X1 [Cinnamomum micranthum f. kanehirae]|uniref:Trafficking protein particle complex subunit 2-like protein n=1 Tax=Cinnamomum micranthum f. kanehirae TaxID=337451 RepID=A0A443NC62_9MAGN|nr:trafficking protein particle complex subunit 2-like protein isoform X1 [Cinnamomum micranthum f. kanehirae]
MGGEGVYGFCWVGLLDSDGLAMGMGLGGWIAVLGGWNGFQMRMGGWVNDVNNPKKTGSTLNEAFLGLLYPSENYKAYGYLTNTKVKFIFVTTDLDVKDADVRNFFKRFHSAYVDAVSNPFHVPGKKITSKTFAERVSAIVKSFGSNAPM